jgi:hypothetical protein
MGRLTARVPRFAAIPVLAALILGFGTDARGDCCMGPPISVGVRLNTPLTATLRPTVVNDDPDHPAEGTVHALLNVRGKRVADLGIVATVASTTPHEIAFDVPASVRRRALRRAGSDRYPRAVIKFVVTARDIPSGVVSRTYGLESFVTLRPPRPTRGPTRVGMGRAVVSGSGERITGSVTLHTPRGWPQTSAPGAPIATYSPLALGASCRAHVFAQPLAIAARSATSYLDDIEIYRAGDVIARDSDGHRAWRIRATPAGYPFPSTTATALVRIARHRYAGIEMTVAFAPACPASAPRSASLVRALRHAMRTVTPHVRLAQRA